MTIANTEPTKRNLITLVNRLVLVLREHADVEEECLGERGPLGSSIDDLKLLIENDFERGCDLSFADLGEEFAEAVLCCCPKSIGGGNHVMNEGVHHPDCDMWDSKASGPEDN